MFLIKIAFWGSKPYEGNGLNSLESNGAQGSSRTGH
jgi:hypothetical protein